MDQTILILGGCGNTGRPIAELLREVRLATIGSAGSFERSLQGHTEIVEAVISGDREQARQAMRRHLEEVNKALDERYAQDGETDPA